MQLVASGLRSLSRESRGPSRGGRKPGRIHALPARPGFGGIDPPQASQAPITCLVVENEGNRENHEKGHRRALRSTLRLHRVLSESRPDRRGRDPN